ncbi:MAG: hypothetical protein JWR61_4692 [Ferruginibacter sp.]|nr:hypothetical protein [Ferruginibacter sp.]MDB5279737.1 hypothetical protein [Ferruginibacter sp.]
MKPFYSSNNNYTAIPDSIVELSYAGNDNSSKNVKTRINLMKTYDGVRI